ncbi:MAG: type I DNA topoisomerase [Bacteroidetes bacterium]|nr:type I DNA topoisomerase [Bacteroidota bacterium]
MSKSLVIVESPAKAKTINKYLGSDYIVEASVGHVRDLPRDGLAIDVANGFVPTYVVIGGKEEVVKRLRALAARCDRVFLATDPDREGEAIAHHIAEAIRDENGNISRVLFNEITRSGVTTAMSRPRAIDGAMVQAQEARRVMDRLIGYKISPFLWRRFAGEARGLSAGRVQSVAVRLVVERERAINSFIAIDYWNLVGHFFTSADEEIVARLVRADGRDLRNPSGSQVDREKDGVPTHIATLKEAEELRDRAMRETYAISSLATKEMKRNPPQPFTTSTVQQEASRRLKINPGRTMKLAQGLYEGVDLGTTRGRLGLITYMRTDSTRVSEEAVDAAEEYIYGNYGKEYLPAPRQAAARTAAVAKKRAKTNVQDAHEAIRPADITITPKEARKHLDKEMADLYELIWSRFVASQMAPAVFDQTTVEISGGPFLFRASGRITRFHGWMQIYAEMEPEDEERGRRAAGARGADDADRELETILPAGIRKGDELSLREAEIKGSQTKPPARYTESLLVKELEAKGIGRPSTYAAIIATIQERGYVEQRERKLHATELGMKVCDVLVNGFPALFDVKFTAKMEGELDTIAGGSATYVKVMQRFYKPLEESLRTAGRGGARAVAGYSRLGIDMGRGSAPLPAGDGNDAANSSAPVGQPAPAAGEAVPCDACGAPMRRRRGRGGSEFYGCSNYPACTATKAIPLDVHCPACGEGALVERVGGRYNSVFYGCTRYPECRFTSSRKPVNMPCPHCGNRWSVESIREGEGTVTECPKCRKRV